MRGHMSCASGWFRARQQHARRRTVYGDGHFLFAEAVMWSTISQVTSERKRDATMPRQHLSFLLQVPGKQRNVRLNDVGLLFGSMVHWFNVSCRYSRDVGGPGTVVNSTAHRSFFRFEQNKMFFCVYSYYIVNIINYGSLLTERFSILDLYHHRSSKAGNV